MLSMLHKVRPVLSYGGQYVLTTVPVMRSVRSGWLALACPGWPVRRRCSRCVPTQSTTFRIKCASNSLASLGAGSAPDFGCFLSSLRDVISVSCMAFSEAFALYRGHRVWADVMRWQRSNPIHGRTRALMRPVARGFLWLCKLVSDADRHWTSAVADSRGVYKGTRLGPGSSFSFSFTSFLLRSSFSSSSTPPFFFPSSTFQFKPFSR